MRLDEIHQAPIELVLATVVLPRDGVEELAERGSLLLRALERGLTFVAVGRYLGTVDGQIITFFVMTVAAAEAAVGLALVIALFRHRETLNPDAFTALKW